MQRYSTNQAKRSNQLPGLRNVRGGLDNAVRQAQERKFNSLSIIDADCHQREPFTLFMNYLPEQWKRVVDERNLPYAREEDPFLSGRDEGIGKLIIGVVTRTAPWRFKENRIKRPESDYQ